MSRRVLSTIQALALMLYSLGAEKSNLENYYTLCNPSNTLFERLNSILNGTNESTADEL